MPGITPSNASFALVDLDLSAVALCNQGANSRAHILLTKGKEKPSMTYEELIAQLKPEQVALITKKFADDTAIKDTEISTLKTDLAKKATPPATPPAIPPVAEDIMKTLPPEVQELFKTMKASQDQMIAEKAEELAKTRYQKCKALPGIEETALKEVLKTASPAVIDILEKAATAVEKTLLNPQGTEGNPNFSKPGVDGVYGQLEKAAKDIMKTATTLTFEQAFNKACEDNADIYKKYVKEVTGNA